MPAYMLSLDTSLATAMHIQASDHDVAGDAIVPSHRAWRLTYQSSVQAHASSSVELGGQPGQRRSRARWGTCACDALRLLRIAPHFVRGRGRATAAILVEVACVVGMCSARRPRARCARAQLAGSAGLRCDVQRPEAPQKWHVGGIGADAPPR